MEIAASAWALISFVIKVFIYIGYFFPMVGARVLQYFDLWPTVWPFSPLI